MFARQKMSNTLKYLQPVVVGCRSRVVSRFILLSIHIFPLLLCARVCVIVKYRPTISRLSVSLSLWWIEMWLMEQNKSLLVDLKTKHFLLIASYWRGLDSFLFAIKDWHKWALAATAGVSPPPKRNLPPTMTNQIDDAAAAASDGGGGGDDDEPMSAAVASNQAPSHRSCGCWNSPTTGRQNGPWRRNWKRPPQPLPPPQPPVPNRWRSGSTWCRWTVWSSSWRMSSLETTQRPTLCPPPATTRRTTWASWPMCRQSLSSANVPDLSFDSITRCCARVTFRFIRPRRSDCCDRRQK